MTAHELADALESSVAHISPTIDETHPATGVYVIVRHDVLRLAAQRLRELEAVRHAALMLVQANNNDASMPLLMALHDTLDAALARVGQ